MAKKGKTRARKRVAPKDLAPKDPKRVKGGTLSAPFLPGGAVVAAAVSGVGSVKSWAVEPGGWGRRPRPEPEPRWLPQAGVPDRPGGAAASDLHRKVPSSRAC